MNTITVEVLVEKDIDTVWSAWTLPEHVMRWNHAADDWECPYAENDLREGGKFVFRMSAKDGTTSFDFNGTYTHVVPHEAISYVIEGGRKVDVTFVEEGDGVRVTEFFVPEDINSLELQRGGWQSILNNFKAHAEGL